MSAGVKFMIGQVGTAKNATGFLADLMKNKDIAPVVFITSGKRNLSPRTLLEFDFLTDYRQT